MVSLQLNRELKVYFFPTEPSSFPKQTSLIGKKTALNVTEKDFFGIEIARQTLYRTV